MKQALAALLFLYKQVLGIELPWMQEIGRPRTPKRLPVVLSPAEVDRLLAATTRVHNLAFRLLYGTGLRKMECLRLRVKDVDFDRQLIIVRQGKSNKDRITMLPSTLDADLRQQLNYARALWAADRADQRSGVELPDGLERKYPRAGESWAWFWVFPSDHESIDPRTGTRRRHHLYEETLGKPSKRAAAIAQIDKPISIYTLRHRLRDASAAGRLRHQDHSGTAGPCQREHNHDLHACPGSRWQGGAKSTRCTQR